MGDDSPTDNSIQPEQRCAKCGACTPVCPVFRASGNEIHSARGKQHLAEVFDDQRPGPVFEDIYSKCLLCGACSQVCPQHIDISEEVIEARSGFSGLYGEHGYQKFLARKALSRPELLGAARVLGKTAAELLFRRLPPASGLRLRLALFAQTPKSSELLDSPLRTEKISSVGGEITCFPGCAAQYLYPDIIDAISTILGRYDCQPVIPDGLGCCGLATLASGKTDEARQMAEKNIKTLELSDGPILVSCASCYAHLASYGKLLADDPVWQTRAKLISERVIEISLFLEALIKDEMIAVEERKQGLKVFYHDPCHLRNQATITEEPRKVLASLPGIELLELADGPQCCGQGGLFHVGAPELSAKIRDNLADKIVDLEPDLITTTCSGCLMQLKSAMAAIDKDIPVIHLSALVNSLSADQSLQP
ncbi:MAG: (Fe-S)-binding protein [Desulfofustis sp.]|nr:(Fe-S)-binding protein [Desulfofustis sp.]